MDLNKLTIQKAHQGLKKGEFTAVQLIEAVFGQIKKKNSQINACLFLSEESALIQARKVDQKIKFGHSIGVLEGIPIAIKDNILVQGLNCSAGSKILENYIAPYSATVVNRLKRAGAVIIGKTNLDEFAMGSSTENSAFGPTKNPYDLERVAGGSSGGSAAAVAADMCLGSLGSDTGGSIRQPASFCGVVGFKPTYGQNSRYGLIAFSSSLDQIGPIAKNVEDAEILFQAMAGQDEFDATSFKANTPIAEQEINLNKIKIGVPKEYFVHGLDDKVKATVQRAIDKYEQAGAKVMEISLPHTQYALPCYYIINTAEVSTNLARYDGVKYGLSETGKDLLDGYLKTRQKGFGEETTRRIMLGTYSLSAGYYDAYYLQAQKVRNLIKQELEKVLEQVDVIMAPAAPTAAFKIGEKADDPVEMYLSDIYLVSANLAGIPAISIPCGEVDSLSGKLPVGLQIMGSQSNDKKLLKIASFFKDFD